MHSNQYIIVWQRVTTEAEYKFMNNQYYGGMYDGEMSCVLNQHMGNGFRIGLICS